MSYIKALYLFLRYYTLALLMYAPVPLPQTTRLTLLAPQLRCRKYAPILHHSTSMLSRWSEYTETNIDVKVSKSYKLHVLFKLSLSQT